MAGAMREFRLLRQILRAKHRMSEALHETGAIREPIAAAMQLAWMLMYADNHMHQSCKYPKEGAMAAHPHHGR